VVFAQQETDFGNYLLLFPMDFHELTNDSSGFVDSVTGKLHLISE
jgi:hypothetical protein